MRCECVKDTIHELRARNANIPDRFQHSNFDGFLVTENSVGLEEAIERAKEFAKDFPAAGRGILLQGRPGVGKTKMLCSIANAVLDKKLDYDVLYVDWNDLVRDLGSGESFDSRDFVMINKMVSRIREADLVLMDELGATRPSGYVMDKIYDVINTRYNRARGTCFATNWPDDDPKVESLQHRIGTRLRSRIAEMTELCEIKAKDFRRTM